MEDCAPLLVYQLLYNPSPLHHLILLLRQPPPAIRVGVINKRLSIRYPHELTFPNHNTRRFIMSPIDQDPGASKSFGGCGILEKLPAEVRLRIYEELFHDRTISFHPNVDKSDDYAKDRVTDILSTSKQIRKEAVKVFAAKISVILPIEYSPFFVSPPPNWPVFTKFPPFLPGQDIKHVILKLCPGTYLPKDVTTFLPTLQTWKSIHTESLVMGEKNEVSDLFLADEDWCSMLYGPGVDVTQSETWKVFLSKLFHSKHAVGYLAEIGTLRALPTAAKVVKLLQRDLVFPKLPSIYSTSSGEFIIVSSSPRFLKIAQRT